MGLAAPLVDRQTIWQEGPSAVLAGHQITLKFFHIKGVTVNFNETLSAATCGYVKDLRAIFRLLLLTGFTKTFVHVIIIL